MEDAKPETRMKVLLTKYKNLKKNLEKLEFLKDELAIIPEIDEANAGDTLFYFTFAFRNPEDGFKENLKDIIKLKNYKEYPPEQFEKIFEIVSPFLLFIHSKFL